MPRATAVEIAPTRLCSNGERAKPMHPSSCFAARLNRSAKDRNSLFQGRAESRSHRGCEPLERFIKRKGGINECASRFTRRLGRRGQSYVEHGN
jgi:hypothetical protein